MSDTEQKVDSVQPEAQPVEASSQQEEAYVPKKAFQEVTTDMHKFKNKYKSVTAELEALKAEREAAQQAQLEEQKQFQELYEQQKAKTAELNSQLENANRQFELNSKRAALKAELGEVKDDYLSFARLDEIELLEDGHIDPDSLHKVANEFRQNHPSLIGKPAGGGITNTAAPIENGIQVESLENLSPEEFKARASTMTIEEKKNWLRKRNYK